MIVEPTASVEPESEEEEAAEIARELRANLPGIYVDTWISVTWKNHIRIVLAERLYRRDNYRAAFVMELDDAEGFAKHILRMVERRRARDAELTKKDQGPESESSIAAP